MKDAIHHGRETSTIIDALGPENVSKVCGYLANKEGLSQLEKKYPSISFVFVKIVDDEEYTKEQDRLQLIYQSRLFPIDGDHPYKIYSLEGQISNDDLRGSVVRAAEKFELVEGIGIVNNNILLDNIFGYSINLDPASVIQLIGNSVGDFFDLERMQIRVKFDPRISQLRIMALALIHIKSDALTEESLFEFNKCPMKWPYRLCKNTTVPKRTSDKPTQKICPLCIDLNVSQFMLSSFEKELKQKLEDIGIRIELMAL